MAGKRAPGNKREAIIEAALALFFEHGYEGTSVRMIQKKVGSEAGLFYYYFRSKDEVFDIAVKRFVDGYRAGFEALVAHGRREPHMLLERFFAHVYRETIRYRDQYADKLHWAVRHAIREQAISFMEPYLLQSLRILAENGMPRPPVAPEVLSIMLTHGVCSVILHEETPYLKQSERDIWRAVHLLLGTPPEVAPLLLCEMAQPGDIPDCLALLETARAACPPLDFDALLAARVRAGEALVIRPPDGVAGVALFSRAACALECVAVRPDARGRSAARRLFHSAAARFPVGAALTATAREGGGADSFLAALGFSRGEACAQGGAQCRIFRLTVPDQAVRLGGQSRA